MKERKGREEGEVFPQSSQGAQGGEGKEEEQERETTLRIKERKGREAGEGIRWILRFAQNDRTSFWVTQRLCVAAGESLSRLSTSAHSASSAG